MIHTCIHTYAYKYMPGAAEQLATLKAEGGDVPTVSEEREGGVGGTRRVVAQAKNSQKSFYSDFVQNLS
jgi:hypothetical protein